MSTALAVRTSFDWDNQQQLMEIKKLISQTPLSETEFSYLVQLGKATQLNPFNREIWAIKYSPKSAAQIFIGRDGYRIAASRHPMYLRHQVEAVYSKDEFKIVNSEIVHSFGLSDRGTLVSAYCKVYLKGQVGYSYVYVTMEEYGLSQSVWKDKPATMIKKVAEAQALRQSFPDFFSGTYSDAEMPQDEPRAMTLVSGETNTQKLKNVLGIGEPHEAENNNHVATDDYIEYVDYEPADVPASQDDGSVPQLSLTQISSIAELFTRKNFSQERIKKALAYYGVNAVEELDKAKAQQLISQLERA